MCHQIDAGTASPEELVCHFIIDAKLLSQVVCSVSYALFKLFVLSLVLAYLDIPTHELSAKAGVLSTAANGLTEFFLINGHGDHLVFLIKADRADNGRLESIYYKDRRVITPTDNINLFIIKLTHNVFDACSTQTNTCAYWIYFVVITRYGNLSAVSGLPGDSSQLDRIIGNLCYLGFKQTTHKVRMATGKNDLRTACLVFNSYHVYADTITDVVFLSNDTFTRRNTTFKFSKVDHDITLFKATHRATDDITSAVLILFINHFLLSHAQTLHHGLLGSLSGNTTKVLRSDIE